MAKKTIKEASDADLFTQIKDAKDELFKLRFQKATGQLENTALLKNTRRQVAKVMTEIREREITAAEAVKTQGEG